LSSKAAGAGTRDVQTNLVPDGEGTTMGCCFGDERKLGRQPDAVGGALWDRSGPGRRRPHARRRRGLSPTATTSMQLFPSASGEKNRVTSSS
jgi:hypothetical protein